MKEFIIKHPFISLFALDITVSGVLKAIALIKGDQSIEVVRALEGTTADNDSKDEGS